MGGKAKDENEDCRAISDDFLKKLMPKESVKEEGYNYNAFLELVKKYSDELVLCFRGNNAGSEAVCIYYNNHLVYKIEDNGNITINFNHARYSKEYKDLWRKIIEYGFIPTDKHYSEEIPKISLRENESESYSANIGYITGRFKEGARDSESIENVYKNCLRPMMIDWFSEAEDKKKDYFGEAANKDPQNFGKNIIIDRTKTKKLPLEKIRQQQLFCAMKSTQNGYFFFDMEFAQKSLKDMKDNEKEVKNQPDMLAIRFEDGRLAAYVLVEVKSTTGACTGKSGIGKHLEEMEQYRKGCNMPARRREAARIINQYKELGLYPSLRDIKEENFEKLKKIEILFIFTDEAVSVLKKLGLKEDNKEFKKLNDEFKRINTEYEVLKYGDKNIHLPGCKGLEIVEFKK